MQSKIPTFLWCLVHGQVKNDMISLENLLFDEDSTELIIPMGQAYTAW